MQFKISFKPLYCKWRNLRCHIYLYSLSNKSKLKINCVLTLPTACPSVLSQYSTQVQYLLSNVISWHMTSSNGVIDILIHCHLWDHMGCGSWICRLQNPRTVQALHQKWRSVAYLSKVSAPNPTFVPTAFISFGLFNISSHNHCLLHSSWACGFRGLWPHSQDVRNQL